MSFSTDIYQSRWAIRKISTSNQKMFADNLKNIRKANFTLHTKTRRYLKKAKKNCFFLLLSSKTPRTSMKTKQKHTNIPTRSRRTGSNKHLQHDHPTRQQQRKEQSTLLVRLLPPFPSPPSSLYYSDRLTAAAYSSFFKIIYISFNRGLSHPYRHPQTTRVDTHTHTYTQTCALPSAEARTHTPTANLRDHFHTSSFLSPHLEQSPPIFPCPLFLN